MREPDKEPLWQSIIGAFCAVYLIPVAMVFFLYVLVPSGAETEAAYRVAAEGRP